MRASEGDDSAGRLEIVRRHATLRWRADPVPVVSHSNDTWLLEDEARGACVLRVGWRGDRGRLLTEARIGRALPAAVGYPPVLGFGWTRDEGDLSWSLTRRLPGRTLAEIWPELDDVQRQEAGRTVGRLLRVLHDWHPPASVSDRLVGRRPSDAVSDLVGDTILPLPFPRVLALAKRARQLSGVDPSVLDVAVGWLVDHVDLAPELDRPGLPVLHGDLHLANVWWDGRRVSGLLDLEWARHGSAFVDLSRLQDEGDAPDAAHLRADEGLVAEQILVGYPELAVPRLADRLRYCRIAYQIRRSWIVPPPEPLAALKALLD